MASIYKRLGWGPGEAITTNKLNDMIGNSDWLYQNAMTGYYDVLGITRDSGLTIRTGYIKILNTESMGQVISTYYAKPFLPGSRPVILTGLACDNYFGIMHAVKGLDGRSIPDHRGFLLQLWQNREGSVVSKFSGDQHVSYLAISPNG